MFPRSRHDSASSNSKNAKCRRSRSWSITRSTRANGGSGFFQDHPDAKAVMNRVAYEMGQRVTANLAAIIPCGGNSWSAPSSTRETGGQYAVSNLARRGEHDRRLRRCGRCRATRRPSADTAAIDSSGASVGKTPTPRAAGPGSRSGVEASPSTPR